MGEAMRRQEAVCGNAQGGMVVESSPVAPLVMGQAKLLLEFPVIAFDTPPHLGDKHQLVDAGVCRSRREPVVIGSLCLFGPFDQQPFFGTQFARQVRVVRWPNSNTRKARGQGRIRPFAPSERL